MSKWKCSGQNWLGCSTRKVKRNLMHGRYKSLVDEMYDYTEQRLQAESAGDV